MQIYKKKHFMSTCGINFFEGYFLEILAQFIFFVTCKAKKEPMFSLLFDYTAGTWQGIVFFSVAILLSVIVIYLIIKGSKK